MFDFDQPAILAGFLLGIASSVHCFGMCSGVAASLCMSAPSSTWSLRELAWNNVLINAGRITGYVVAGMAVGALGTSVFGVLDHSTANIVLRWAAAVSLGWIGLSMIGSAPVLAPLVRLSAAVNGKLAPMIGSYRSAASAGLFVSGCVWGFLPCAMVYAALFYAMLSASWLKGAAVMLGFGIGTLPPVLSAGLGLPWLRSRARSPLFQKLVGVALLTLAVVSTLPTATIAGWCMSG